MRVTLTHGIFWLEAPAAPARPDDATLVALARDGDIAACRVVYRQYGPRIRRFLGDLLRDPALADDATQETFARAFRRLPSLDEPERFVGWLFGVARNVGLELRKARARRSRLVSPQPDADVACETTPERALLGREAAAIVGRALERLPEDRKAALLLRVDHQLAYGEIAAALGWSLAKAKIEVHRARETLRAALDSASEGP